MNEKDTLVPYPSELGIRYAVKDWRDQVPDKFPDFPTRHLRAITKIVIHHTVTPPNNPDDSDHDWEGIIRSIYQYHTLQRGWPGIGYHYIITPDPAVYYVGDVHTIRACVAHMNTHVVCIALLGNYMTWEPPFKMLSVLRERIEYMRQWWPWIRKVVGHRDVAVVGHETACPGDTWIQWKRKLGV